MMINDAAAQPRTAKPSWQEALRDAYRDPGALLADLGLSNLVKTLPARETRTFPMRVPRGFAARMRPGQPRDPLLLQVLPQLAENFAVHGFGPDPVGDLGAVTDTALLRKYQGRALLISTGTCAVHCRYCFRRSFPYHEQMLSPHARRRIIDVLKNDQSIHEVILSGGDPLMLSNNKLATLLDEVGTIEQVTTIRIHTRVPIVLPERVDDELLCLLSTAAKSIVIVVHSNHGQELSGDVRLALLGLAGTSHALLNQSVLLAGINDDADTLVELSQRLFECRALPYYLHQLDRVGGAAHFEVADVHAQELITQVQARLPGYLVPRLVRESEGAAAKLPLTNN